MRHEKLSGSLLRECETVNPHAGKTETSRALSDYSAFDARRDAYTATLALELP